MRILDSDMSLAAQRQYSSTNQTMLAIRSEAPRPSAEVEISPQAQAAQATPDSQEIDIAEAIENDPRLKLIIQLIETLTGKVFDLKHLRLRSPDKETDQPASASTPNTPTPATEGGTAIRYEAVRTESEAVQFSASGIVKTADGREIAFKTELTMSRSFSETIHFDMATGSLVKKDPLVLNYNAPAATLSADTFAFDLDADGKAENIAQLNAGSAYLALDRNQDGQINDGLELFGTQNGDGFADLAQFDQDRNNWIDEGDAVFAQLKLWLKDASGQDQLVDLNRFGIGALYLGRAQADFSLNDAQNQPLGQIRAHGIYLNENGGGGTLQQVDLLV